MKRLMIAAAAAAMIGGAFAADSVAYAFKASLKTTDGKNGSAVALKVQLGQNQYDQWWYEDAAAAGWTKPGKDGVPALDVKGKTDAEKKAFADAMKAYSDIGDGKPEVYRGKEKWCASFSYKASSCYRTAGTYKIDMYLLGDCCQEFKEIYNEDGVWYDGDAVISTTLLYRFGGITLAKATKVEFCGDFGAVDGTEEWGAVNGFALAGQGTWSGKLFTYNGYAAAGVKSISGNIVGMLENAECEVCCGADPFAKVWDCDAASDEDALDAASALGTAAFGTFSMKFDKKATFGYYGL